MNSLLDGASDCAAPCAVAPRGWRAPGGLARAALLGGLLSGLLSACSDEALPPLSRGDGRSARADLGLGGPDAGPRADARSSDARVGAIDRGVDAGGTTTDPWPCLAAPELSGWVLAQDYCVVAQALRPAASAWAYAEQALWSFGPWSEKLGSIPLRRFAWRAGAEPGQPEDVGTVPAAGAPMGTGVLVFPGAYLARAGSGSVAVGFTRADGVGAVALVTGGGQGPSQVNAPGNFDAAWLDDRTLLVNGMGLEATESTQALYAWSGAGSASRLVKDLGAASSYVAVGRSVVYVGGAFGSFPSLTNRVFAFERSQLSMALSERRELDGDDEGVEVHRGDLGDLTTVGDELVWLDSFWDEKSFAMVARGVFRRGVQRSGGRLAPLGTPLSLLTPGSTVAAQPVGLGGDGARLLVVLDRGTAGHALWLLRPR